MVLRLDVMHSGMVQRFFVASSNKAAKADIEAFW